MKPAERKFVTEILGVGCFHRNWGTIKFCGGGVDISLCKWDSTRDEWKETLPANEGEHHYVEKIGDR